MPSTWQINQETLQRALTAAVGALLTSMVHLYRRRKERRQEGGPEMPQGSLFNESEVHTVELKLVLDEVRQRTLVTVLVQAKSGAVLSSAGVTVRGMDEVELLPAFASMVAMGYLYKGANETVREPVSWLKSEIKQLRRKL